MSYEEQFQRDHLRARAWGVEARIANVTREISPAERDAMERAQARFDSVVAHTGGGRACAPLMGETALEYRLRLLRPLAAAHERFRKSHLGSLDSPSLAVIEDIVYHDAVEAAKRVPDGQLRAVSERDAAGRLVTRFYGDPMAWMQRFAAPGAIGTINRNPPVKS